MVNPATAFDCRRPWLILNPQPDRRMVDILTIGRIDHGQNRNVDHGISAAALISTVGATIVEIKAASGSAMV